MNVFISQPMKDRSDEEILKERKRLFKLAQAKYGNVEVLETFFDFGPDANPLYYLAKSIEMLSQADVALFAPGWKNARGCRIEHECAIEYGITVLEA